MGFGGLMAVGGSVPGKYVCFCGFVWYLFMGKRGVAIDNIYLK